MNARALVSFCLLLAIPTLNAQDVRLVETDPAVLAADFYHLGDTTTAWPEAPPDPEGRELQVPFHGPL